ncbi:MAG: hypothetical protein A2X25_14410 [Chloroflexi bacterium GWB2_49_20]|nr:MAG: hypothetical protein A2X25_14410 [Chloroflexi bacterium GWB2_49_20]OGN79838.1 MAG: hypothetical protein A2X26_02340 [Chloroflexi bacterium GWC2_49_37]OGN85627.1 MAG: hypothetical protein A2X27_04720 [Chloroflexi bacterium GWD2_49_16]HBG74507.1 hypothetical protein [Anaerolineae bacterium]HCC79619.1 hypothetical protein [Anaerolineae bacterium]
MITPEILKALLWPLVVLIIGVLFLFLFRKDISSLLNRLKKAKWPGGAETLFFGEANVDKLTPLDEENEKLKDRIHLEGNKAVKWSNSGNIFWVGHDLMWTIDVIIRGAPRENIVHGLRQSLHHIRSLGFVNTPIEIRLLKLIDNAEKSLQEDWTPTQRNTYAGEIGSILGYIGKLAESNQANFEPNPENKK